MKYHPVVSVCNLIARVLKAVSQHANIILVAISIFALTFVESFCCISVVNQNSHDAENTKQEGNKSGKDQWQNKIAYDPSRISVGQIYLSGI